LAIGLLGTGEAAVEPLGAAGAEFEGLHAALRTSAADRLKATNRRLMTERVESRSWSRHGRYAGLV